MQKDIMPKYCIGQPLFENKPVLPEGMYYRFQDKEHLVLYILPERASISTRATLLFEAAEFAFAVQESILFFLARFGRYHWRMASYYWHLVPAEERSLPKEIENSDGSAELQILLIDHSLGCVQGIRKVRLTPQITDFLHRSIEYQASLPGMGIKSYHDILTRVQTRYPRPKDLLATARVRMTDYPLLPAPRKKETSSE